MLSEDRNPCFSIDYWIKLWIFNTTFHNILVISRLRKSEYMKDPTQVTEKFHHSKFIETAQSVFEIQLPPKLRLNGFSKSWWPYLKLNNFIKSDISIFQHRKKNLNASCREVSNGMWDTSCSKRLNILVSVACLTDVYDPLKN